MFSFERQITRILHDEHMFTSNMLEKLEGLFMNHGPNKIPDNNNPEIQSLLGEISNHFDCDVKNHFTFEEEKLFPILDAGGDTSISKILTGEHEVILPLCIQLAALAKQAQTDGFQGASWTEFRQLGGELVERLKSHIQKEEMALLPMLEDFIEEDKDGELMMEYAQTR